MKNISQSKELLKRALQGIGDDHALSESRRHILTAIREIEFVEKKRNKREVQAVTPEQRWQMDLSAGQLKMPEHIAKKFLANIEDMIAQEKSKLEPKEKDENIGTILD